MGIDAIGRSIKGACGLHYPMWIRKVDNFCHQEPDSFTRSLTNSDLEPDSEIAIKSPKNSKCNKNLPLKCYIKITQKNPNLLIAQNIKHKTQKSHKLMSPSFK